MTRLTTLRDVLRPFQEAGVLTLADVHTAVQVCRLAEEPNEHVLLALALAVRALRFGSVCLELDRIRHVTSDIDLADGGTAVGELPWPATDELLAALRRSPLVIGAPTGLLRPLTLINSDGGWLLYLDRYFKQEQTIRRVLTEREQSRPAVDPAQVATALETLFRDEQQPHTVTAAPDRQRVAAALAATEWTTIVAGGPGTGKTHTAARILAMLYAMHGPTLRVALAAPTGARLPGTCRVHRRSTAGPSKVHADTAARRLTDAPRGPPGRALRRGRERQVPARRSGDHHSAPRGGSLPRDPIPREEAALADGFRADRTNAINDRSSGWQTRRRSPG